MAPRASSTWWWQAGRVRRGLLALLTLAAGGCAWDLPMSTFQGRSDFARSILHVYAIIAWATLFIAIVVGVILVWVLAKYRGREGAGLPRQIRGHSALEIGWTIAPAFVLLIIAIPTIQVIFKTQAPAPSNALTVTVKGWQWWWEFRYPSLDAVTANELHIPTGRPVLLQLEGPDVIHSFWVPRLGGKRDVVPGRHNQLVFTADTPGEYWGQCAEFCGASHANMRMKVVVLEPGDFDKWVAAQKAPPAEPSGAAADGKALYAKSACVGCHTIRGVSSGTIAPDLTHFGSRRTLASGILSNTPDNVTAWLLDPPAIKPGSKMPALGLTPEQARAISAYLGSLK